MYVINTRINNITVTFKFRRSQHAIERAKEIALKQGKAGVKVTKQDKHVHAIAGHLFGWRGATRTYIIGAGTT